jgi:hypothetical protein
MSRETLITIYGVVAVTFMMTMYALERRHPAFILAFAVIAVRRYLATRQAG